jgi:hypothetical protein
MSQLKVNGIRATSASSDAISLAADGTCTAKITNYPHRNLIINGAMLVKQRGGGAVTANGSYVADRFKMNYGDLDEAPTMSSIDLGSTSTGPWEVGLKSAIRITNGNQTGGAGAADHSLLTYIIEAQDIRNSGWDYNSTSSYITLSFWVRSSVAQTFYGFFETADGTSQAFSWSTGALSANTWKKVVVKVPGNTNLTFDNNTGQGIYIYPVWFFCGTDRTTSGHTLNTWANYSGSDRMPDNTSTWHTTNDATFDITGVQLEVGDTATDFEHRSYADELNRCMRYYQSFSSGRICSVSVANNTEAYGLIRPAVHFRGTPSISVNALGKILKENTAWYDVSALNINSSGTDNTCVAIQIMSSGGNNMSAQDYATLGNGTSFSLVSEL